MPYSTIVVTVTVFNEICKILYYELCMTVSAREWLKISRGRFDRTACISVDFYWLFS